MPIEEIRITPPGYLDYACWRLEYLRRRKIEFVDHFIKEIFQNRLPAPEDQHYVVIKRLRFDSQDVEGRKLFERIEDITSYDPEKSAQLVADRIEKIVVEVGKEEALDINCALTRVTEAGKLEKIDLS